MRSCGDQLYCGVISSHCSQLGSRNSSNSADLIRVYVETTLCNQVIDFEPPFSYDREKFIRFQNWYDHRCNYQGDWGNASLPTFHLEDRQTHAASGLTYAVTQKSSRSTDVCEVSMHECFNIAAVSAENSTREAFVQTSFMS
jgi:hypothetical protein